MLDFLRSYKASLTGSSGPVTENELADTLKRLRDSCQKVFVQFGDENVTYACNVGAFNLEHSVVVVSNLCNEIPSSTLKRGGRVDLIVREKGGANKIECCYIEPLVENIISALQLQLPQSA